MFKISLLRDPDGCLWPLLYSCNFRIHVYMVPSTAGVMVKILLMYLWRKQWDASSQNSTGLEELGVLHLSRSESSLLLIVCMENVYWGCSQFLIDAFSTNATAIKLLYFLGRFRRRKLIFLNSVGIPCYFWCKVKSRVNLQLCILMIIIIFMIALLFCPDIDVIDDAR